MADFGGLVRNAARQAGRTIGAVSRQFAGGKAEGALPQDDSGRVKIVCRRYVEKRAVTIEGGAPECYEPNNSDCESCLEDVQDGTVETW